MKHLQLIPIVLGLCLNSYAQTGWTALGTLPGTGQINALAVTSAGTLFAGGEGGNNFLKWNSNNTWTSPGSVSNKVYAMKATGNTVYATGLVADGNGLLTVGNYNGTTWNTVNGLGAQSAYVYAVTTDASGNIYAAGSFWSSSGYCYVAKWNGSSWSELGGTNGLNITLGVIYALASDASGNIYAAGSFQDANSHYYVAKYDGTQWTKLGTGLNFNDNIRALAVDAAGNVYAAGDFFSGFGSYVAKCSNGTWSVLSGSTPLNANNGILALAISGSNIYAGGKFTNSSGKQYVARWNGSGWSELTGTNSLGANGNILGVAADAAGNVYAAGAFTNSSGKPYVARFGSTAGVENSTVASNFTLMPNYGSGRFQLTGSEVINGEVTITVYNMLGSAVITLRRNALPGNFTESLDLTDQPTGSYIVSVGCNGLISSAVYCKL